jgi:RecB family endonuclease NucS
MQSGNVGDLRTFRLRASERDVGEIIADHPSVLGKRFAEP